MLANGLVKENAVAPEAPTNSSCTDAEHAAQAAAAGQAPAGKAMRFF